MIDQWLANELGLVIMCKMLASDHMHTWICGSVNVVICPFCKDATVLRN